MYNKVRMPKVRGQCLQMVPDVLDLFSMNMFRVVSSLETVFMIESDKIITGVSSIRNPA